LSSLPMRCRRSCGRRKKVRQTPPRKLPRQAPPVPPA